MKIKAIHQMDSGNKKDSAPIKETVYIVQFAIHRDMSNDLCAIFIRDDGTIHWDDADTFKVIGDI